MPKDRKRHNRVSRNPDPLYYRKVVGQEVPFHRLLDADENDGRSCLFMTNSTSEFSTPDGYSGDASTIIGGGMVITVKRGKVERQYVIKTRDAIQSAIAAFITSAPDGEAS
jgi:hypothetical protein